jgi:hypothetical protein
MSKKMYNSGMATQPPNRSDTPTPYGSAKDLPSYQEMAQLIQGGRLLTLILARNQREEILEIERKMKHLAKVVDDFYERLGHRNWIFHDLLSVDKVEIILTETSDSETAEQRFIQIYRDYEATKWWTMRLKGQDGLRERVHQIELARQHYEANQFDSCVLQLIAVMDGFVNDFEPSIRKGLSSRNPDDMTAWDSVVGHHMGLTHVMKTFTKTIKKRIDSEVIEVYRHGIMHGIVVNMLFAIADWATATKKAAEPRKSAPSWSDTWSALNRRAAYNRYENEFVPSMLTPSDPGFDSDEVVIEATEFLNAWRHKRWGLVAAFTPTVLLASKSQGEQALYAKNLFEPYDLAEWDISTVTYDTASGSEVRAFVTVNQKTTDMRFRMVLQKPDGNVAMPTDEGATWRVAIWAPHTFFLKAV